MTVKGKGMDTKFSAGFACVAFAFLSSVVTGLAHGQAYPSKAVRIVVPSSAGSLIDSVARSLAERLQRRLGRQVIVEDKAGAGGAIGLKSVAEAAPDGYTVVLAVLPGGSARSLAFLPQLGVNLAKDFEPVGTIANVPSFLVVPPSPRFKSLKELIDYGRRNPQKLTYGSLGEGSVSGLLARDFGRMAGIDWIGVPYRAAPESMQALMSNRIDLVFSPLSAVNAEVRSGKVKAFAIADAKRSPLLPNVPTLSELGGPALDGGTQYVILAPAKTPVEILNKLGGAIRESVREESLRPLYAALGVEPLTITREEVRVRLSSDAAKYSKAAANGGGGRAAAKVEAKPEPQVQPKPPPPAPKVAAELPAPKAEAPKPAAARAEPLGATAGEAPPLKAEAASKAKNGDTKKGDAKADKKGDTPLKPAAVAALPGPVWNGLAENRGDRYRPVDQLRANRFYTIRIDLAALAYAQDQPGILVRQPGKVFWDFLPELAKTSKDPTDVLTAVILTDAAVFATDAAPQQITLRLDRVRRFLNGEMKLPAAPLSQLQKDGDADFVFAPLSFEVQTNEVLPKTRGSVAVSIWYGGKPVDEIAVDFCTVESGCSGVRLGQSDLGGVDSAGTALAGKSTLPEAALHLLSMGSGVAGVFRVNRAKDSPTQGYVAWLLNKTPSDLSTQIDGITQTLGKTAVDGLSAQGYAMFGALFPASPPSSGRAAAIFTDYVKSEISAEKPGAVGRSSTFFVRAQFPGKTPPTLIPLGMTSVRTGEKKFEFLGQHFRVETPLRIQIYGGAAACIRNWQVVGPPPGAEQAFQDARSALKMRLKPGDQGRRVLEIGDRQFPVIDRMEDFFYWIIGGAVDQPTVLSILSHHNLNQVKFDNFSVAADDVRRSFVQHPTVAILNGCTTGAGEAGATGFIRKLNDMGVKAVIASVTEVEGKMAGDFLDCFAQQAETAPAEGRLLSDAFAGALYCLDKTKGYGAKAYWYSLLGDGGLRLCKP